MNDPQSSPRKVCEPLTELPAFRLAVCVAGFFILAVLLYQFYLPTPFYPVNYYPRGGYGRGGDFWDFHVSAVSCSLGGQPHRFLAKPPFLSVALQPLSSLSFPAALHVYQGVTTLLLCLVVVLVCRRLGHGFWTTLALLVMMLGTFPFQFLIDRGNADGIALSLAFFGVLVASTNGFAAPLLLAAAAVNYKTNVLPLALAVCLVQGWRPSVLRTCIFMMFAISVAALTPAWSIEYLDIMRMRAGYAPDYVDIASAFTPFTFFDSWLVAGWSFLLLTLVSVVAGVMRRIWQKGAVSPLVVALLLLPFTVAYPQRVYLYSYVLVPLLLLLYVPLTNTSGPRYLRTLGWIGVIATLAMLIPCRLLLAMGASPAAAYLPVGFGLVASMLVNSAVVWSDSLSTCFPRSTAPAGKVSPMLERVAKFAGVVLALAAAYEVIAFCRGSSRVLWFPAPVSNTIPQALESGIVVRSATQGWGKLAINRSVGGVPARVKGKLYRSALGTHAASLIEVEFPPGASTFSGSVAVDDSSVGRSNGMKFRIKVGSDLLFESPIVVSGADPVPFSVELSGAETARLLVESVDGNVSFDHADWLDLTVDRK